LFLLFFGPIIIRVYAKAMIHVAEFLNPMRGPCLK